MERPKVKRVHVRETSVLSRQDDGTWRMEFPGLGLVTTGATEDEAYQAMRAAITDAIEDDDTEARWIAFAEANHTVEDLPDEDWAEMQRTIAEGAAASAGLAVLDAASFDAFVAGPTPALVDFWAEWCMPCHWLAPVLRQVADRLEGRLRVGKLNIEAHRSVWEQVDSAGLPTMVVYRDGAPVHMIVGFGHTPDELAEEIEPHLG